MAVGQYQLVIKGEGPKLQLLLLNTATGHVHVAARKDEQLEWRPFIDKSPPAKPMKLKMGKTDV